MMFPLVMRNILLVTLFNGVLSRSIINNLPGYPGELPFKIETGYVGVGESKDVQLFYYFVESERNPKNDPLIIWIPGGPGCSCLRALFYEIGPLKIDYAKSSGNKPALELNPYSWTKVANVIFLDGPVGTGFSYANTWEAYNTGDSLAAVQTYDFLRKWLMDHPKFMKNPLYVTGVSYSGIVIPIVTQEIYKGNEAGNAPPMNIKGYIIGNPLTNKNSDVNSRVEFAHRMALLSDELYESTKENCHGNYIEIAPNNTLCVKDLQIVDRCIEKIYVQHILEPTCGTLTAKQNLQQWEQENPITLTSSLPDHSEPYCRKYNYLFSSIWANDKAVQDALHIREGTIVEWPSCNQTIQYTFGENASASYTYDVLSSVDNHRYLTTKNCRALIFSGDHDMLVPYVGTLKWMRTLNLTVETSWEPWLVNGQEAGFTVLFSHDAYTLTYATVKGGGHVAPEYKPKECLAMVERWFAYYPL